MTTTTHPPAADERIARLSTASVRKVLEPEELFDWASLGEGQVIGDELLTTSGLDLDLEPDDQGAPVPRGSRGDARDGDPLRGGAQRRLRASDRRDPATSATPASTYMLHEIAEETRHQRAFIRLIEELEPRAVNPVSGRRGRSDSCSSTSAASSRCRRSCSCSCSRVRRSRTCSRSWRRSTPTPTRCWRR